MKPFCDHAHYCLEISFAQMDHDIIKVGATAYARTCRSNFKFPGFFLIDLGPDIDSRQLRHLMVALKQSMDAEHRSRRPDSHLIFRSLARFDQQESIRPHRDAGPPECFLMLGYEPTEIVAELTMFDYAKCAAELSLSPDEFLVKHNPMFKAGMDLLTPYATPICWTEGSSPPCARAPPWSTSPVVGTWWKPTC